ncbi:MAG: response regulator, partial [Bacteroidota bacterium]
MKLTIKSLLAILFSSFILILIFACYEGITAIGTINNQSTNILEREVNKNILAWDILNDQKTISGKVQEMILTPSAEGKRDLKEQLIISFREANAKISDLKRVEDPSGKELLDRVKKAIDDYQSLVYKEYARTYENILKGTAANNRVEEEVSLVTRDVSGKVEDLLKEFVLQKNTNVDIARKQASQAISTLKLFIILFIVVLFLFGLVVLISILWFVYSVVGGEPGVIKDMTGKITEGNLNLKFPPETKGIFNSIRILQETLLAVANKAENIAGGDFSVEIIPQSEDDQLGNSLAKMTRTLSDLGTVTEEISQGNFDKRLEVKGENDMVSKSINTMSLNLKKNESHNREQNWLKDGLNKLSLELSGEMGLDRITSTSVSFISRYVDAGRGVIYLNDEEKKNLRLVSSFAFTERDHLSNVYEYGNGVVGQVALEKKAIFLRNIPKNEAPISTGTIQTSPTNTYTYPLVYEDELLGVIELASLTPFSSIQTAFLDESNQIIASGIYLSVQREKIEDLLDKAQTAQREAEEKTMQVQEANARLEEQQQQIQQQSEELQQTNSQLEEQQQQLQQQSEELQQTNAQLEEQQQQLMQQAEELRQGNEQLRTSKSELDLKAKDLELSNKYKSDFLANMSHELRTPLNSIILLSKMIQKNERGNLSNDDIKRAKVVHSAGEELLRLINDILDLSKIEAGKTTLSLGEVTTGDLLNELKHYFSSVAKNKGLVLKVEDKLKTSITTDRDKLSQILRNFTSNALKFTKTGSVTITAEESGIADRPVKISVLDTGIGIPVEKHKMVFDAFQQVDTSISREFGGTGLGLTISKQLAGLLHGTITLKSEHEKGSEFSILLPKVLMPAEGEQFEHEQPQSYRRPVTELAPFPQKREDNPLTDDRKELLPGDKIILIVEDDFSFAEIVTMVIHNMKMKVLYASTAEEGLRMAQQFRISGIVLDLVLPDMNGVDFMRRLKSFKELRHIPVQIISGHEKNPELLRMGALDFLQKPVDQEQIQNAIQGILNFSQKHPKDLLIVEDDDTHREALTELISSEDVRVKGVGSEQEATDELKKGIYDAVIIDLGLKSGSGLEICKFVKESQLKVPVIVYTGKQLSQDEER